MTEEQTIKLRLQIGAAIMCAVHTKKPVDEIVADLLSRIAAITDRPPVDSVGVDYAAIVDTANREPGPYVGSEYHNDPARRIRQLVETNHGLMDKLRAALTAPVDVEKGFDEWWRHYSVIQGFNCPSIAKGYCKDAYSAALTAPADGKPCKTRREVGEHHPDCTPQPEEDT